MLEIRLRTDIPALTGACHQYGAVPGPDFYLYEAADGGEVLAWALFQVESDRVQVVGYHGDGEDFFLFDGILRAGLNYASEQGIGNGLIPEAFRQQHKAMFERLNYPPTPLLNIQNFFTKYKNCAGLL